MVEAPLLVRPYLASMSRSELFVVMTAGMATIAGTVFALYATFLKDIIPDPAGHLLTASIISAPAAVVIAQVMLPPQGEEVEERVEFTRLYRSGLDALTTGTIDGLRLLAYIIGMLIVLIALVELANIVLALVPDVDGGPLTLQRMLGWVLAPLAWALGIPWSEATTAGQLLGIKVVLNELVAYFRMAELPAGSIGIMVGGIGAIVPERRLEIAQLGLKSIVAGTMATCMTGAVIGLLHW